MQKILFPMKYINITTGIDMLSHVGTYAIDNAGKDTGIDQVFAPFTGVIKKIWLNGNTVWLESIEPVLFADGTKDYAVFEATHANDVNNLFVGKVINQGEVFYKEGTSGNASGNHVHMEIGKGKFSGSGWYQNSKGIWTINNGYIPWNAYTLKEDAVILNGLGYPWIKEEDIVKPTEQEVQNLFQKNLGHPATNQQQVDYYTSKDIRVLYADLMGNNVPTEKEVKEAYSKYLPGLKDPNAVAYYTNNPKSLLFSNIAGSLQSKLIEEQSKPPVTIEVPVEVIVEKEVIREVIVGDENRTFGDLLSAALKKVFNIK